MNIRGLIETYNQMVSTSNIKQATNYGVKSLGGGGFGTPGIAGSNTGSGSGFMGVFGSAPPPNWWTNPNTNQYWVGHQSFGIFDILEMFINDLWNESVDPENQINTSMFTPDNVTCFFNGAEWVYGYVVDGYTFSVTYHPDYHTWLPSGMLTPDGSPIDLPEGMTLKEFIDEGLEHWLTDMDNPNSVYNTTNVGSTMIGVINAMMGGPGAGIDQFGNLINADGSPVMLPAPPEMFARMKEAGYLPNWFDESLWNNAPSGFSWELGVETQGSIQGPTMTINLIDQNGIPAGPSLELDMLTGKFELLGGNTIRTPGYNPWWSLGNWPIPNINLGDVAGTGLFFSMKAGAVHPAKSLTDMDPFGQARRMQEIIRNFWRSMLPG